MHEQEEQKTESLVWALKSFASLPMTKTRLCGENLSCLYRSSTQTCLSHRLNKSQSTDAPILTVSLSMSISQAASNKDLLCYREVVLYPYGRHDRTDNIALYLGAPATVDVTNMKFSFTIVNQQNPDKSISTGETQSSVHLCGLLLWNLHLTHNMLQAPAN